MNEKMEMENLLAGLQKLKAFNPLANETKRRKLFIEFSRRKNELKEIQDWLPSKKKYLSPEKRDLTIKIIRYLSQEIPLGEVDCIINIFRSLSYIPLEARTVMSEILKIFFEKYGLELDNPSPTSDVERFDLLCDGREVTREAFRQLCEWKVFTIWVLPYQKKIEIMGEMSPQEFYQKVSEKWSFQHAEEFFDYGQGTIPEGKHEWF